MKKSLLLLAIIISHFYLIGVFSKMFLADLYYKSSKNLLEKGQIQDATKHITQAVRFNHKEPSYKRQKAKILLSTTILMPDEEIKQKALEELNEAQQLNPRNLTTLRNVVPLYYVLAVKDTNKSNSPDNIDPKYAAEAQFHFSYLKNAYPNDLGIYAEVAKYEKKLGLFYEYNQTYEAVSKMRPDILDWHESFK